MKLSSFFKIEDGIAHCIEEVTHRGEDFHPTLQFQVARHYRVGHWIDPAFRRLMAMSILFLDVYHTVQIGLYGYFWLVQTKAKIQELRTKITFHVPPVINDADCNTPEGTPADGVHKYASASSSPSLREIQSTPPVRCSTSCYVLHPTHAHHRSSATMHSSTSVPGPRWFSHRAIHPSPGGGIELLLFAARSGFDFKASVQSDDFLGALGRICRVLLNPPSSPYTCASGPLTTKSLPLQHTDIYARDALQNPSLPRLCRPLARSSPPPPPRVQHDDTLLYQDPQCPHDLQWLDLHWEQGLRQWLPDNLAPRSG
ncbi:hypothetical protein B0H10DRAFT_2211307 [Mycena sp. CBHHK59/15]|nr:hypothetical protein B0H10DRAFT_2211307 [Mycena sp. CBHHK59/15]